MNDTLCAAPATDPEPAAPARGTAEIVYDVGTVLALAAGGLVVPFVGWVAGVALLWNGPRWTPVHRWAGTAAWPIGLAAGALLLLTAPWPPAVIALTGTAVAVGLAGVFVWLAVVAARADR